MSHATHDEATLAAIAAHAVERARRAGVAAGAVVECGGGARVTVRDGDVDTASRDGHRILTVTVFADGRTGSASSAALDRAAVDRVVDEAVAIAARVQPDPDAGLADPAWLAIDGADVALHAADPAGIAGLTDAAFAIERAGRGDGWRVTETGAATSEGTRALATSTGFCRSTRWSHHARWCLAAAPDGALSVQDVDQSEDRRAEALAAPELVARRAVERTFAARGARALGTRRAPVLFAPRVAAALIGDLVGALSGGPQSTRATFLPDPLGAAILADHLDLDEDPFEPFGLASAPFDGEGVAGTRRAIVAGGVATGLFLASRSARRLGMRSTGNAGGPYNLRLASRDGALAPTALLARLGTGLVVDQLLGGATDPVTGTWTRAVAGHWVERGTIVHPVRDVTLAGAMPAMLRGIVALGDDVERFGACSTGSILVDAMQLGGGAA